MARTQLNIGIHPELLKLIKKESRKAGKTVSSFLSEIIANTLSKKKYEGSYQRIDEIEQKVVALERKISSVTSTQQKVTPSTEAESGKCSEFIRAIFNQKLKKDATLIRKQEFIDLIKHISCFHQWSQIYTLRLKEVLFTDDYEPFTAYELNNLTLGKECPCPIRTGLINWIEGNIIGHCSCSNINFPSQQEICEKGSTLVENIF